MYNPDRGFGFIRCDNERRQDLFVHERNVRLPDGHYELCAGDAVEFDVGKSPRNGKAEAQNVRVVT